jgi:hypothetical protein
VRRHVCLTHLNEPAKRYVVLSGPEALWVAGAVALGALLWRALLPACTPMTALDPATGRQLVLAEAPLLLWARDRWPAAEAGLTMYVPFLPLVVFLALVGLVAFLALWEPGGKKLHRWAATYARTWRRCPRVATWQPVPHRPGAGGRT